MTLHWWVMMFNRLRLGNLPIQDPIYMFPSSYIPIYTDASGVHGSNNYLQRGAGVYLVNNTLVRCVWPGKKTWISKHGRSTTLLESLAALQGLLSAISQYGRKAFTIFCDNAGTCHSFRKGSSRCLYSWTVLKVIDEMASGTMSMVSIVKTRRCSGFGETVADTLAKGEISGLDRLGITSPTWLRPSRVLMDWVKKPVVTHQLGKYLLNEISQHMEVVLLPSCQISYDINS